ncbi:MAG: sxtJ [Deltaproteobacteria bacterium]|nr:sxtJ [Deltaproteobacteria bacterium]
MTRGKSGNKQLRDFGLVTGAVFAGLFGLLLPCLKGRALPLWPFLLWVALSVPALLRPQLLKYPYAGWIRVGRVLGWVNSQIILAAIFYLIIVPMGLAARLFGYDPMAREFSAEVDTYRRPSRQAPHKEMERPF